MDKDLGIRHSVGAMEPFLLCRAFHVFLRGVSPTKVLLLLICVSVGWTYCLVQQ